MKTRAVSLKTCTNGTPVYINRSIERLHPLELMSNEKVTEMDREMVKGLTEESRVDDNSNERPKRKAADNGIFIRRLLGST